MKTLLKYLLTGIIVAIAVLMVFFKYQNYFVNPWTRDGQVRASVIQVTPRVSGPIVDLPIRDNQFVKAGTLLFEIDPRTFQTNLDAAIAQFEQTGGNITALERQVEAAQAGVSTSRSSIDQAKSTIHQLESTIEKNQAEYERQKALLPKGATSQKAVERAEASLEISMEKKLSAQAGLSQARSSLAKSQADLAQTQAQLGAIGDLNPQIRASLAAREQAELNLEFTRVLAPVDCYVTNLNLRLGSQAVANQPALALVDINSFKIDGFFKENTIGPIQAGDRAVITLMTYPDTPLEGIVDSIGWGIAQQNGSTGFQLLPTVNPTFEWIRLAQRVPVRVYLTNIPKGVQLRVGTTCSVLVVTDSDNNDHKKQIPAAPTALR